MSELQMLEQEKKVLQWVDPEEAFDLLGNLLVLAASDVHLRTFIDEGPAMARSLYDALSRGISPGNIQRLLSEFPTDDPDPAVMHRNNQQWIEPLTERELEVINLLAEGLSNQEIGDLLYLSKNTVKTHTRNIYRKLGVNNRTLALKKGRSLGLILNI